jgi:hypothetical protein
MFDNLKDAIRAGDKVLTLSLLEELEHKILQGDSESVNELIRPVEITELHKLLTEHLGVQPRAMLVKGRITTRPRRALLFCKAMQNGVNRLG